jgi:hypothetical protein
MNPNELAIHLFSTHDDHRLDHVRPSTCRHRDVYEEIRRLVDRSEGLLSLREAGQSVERRTIPLVSFGRGEKVVLLWSQMHGDEQTATLALVDVFSLLTEAAGEGPWLEELLAGCTVHVIPMLNPDGAERGQRANAAGLDVNRDARALVTPEGRALRQAHRTLRPEFGFNLHDQGLYSAGESRNATAIALLAPSLDARRTTPPVRRKAKQLGSLISASLDPFVHGHLATWDDTYDRRTFGDSFQGWGTSTLLIESGHWRGDPEKHFIRKLNFVALLTALHSIATDSYEKAPVQRYARIPRNGTKVFDVLLRDVELHHRSSSWKGRVDVGLMRLPSSPGRRPEPVAVRVREVGDLGGYGALEERDLAGGRLPASLVSVGAIHPLERFTPAPLRLMKTSGQPVRRAALAAAAS